MIRKPDPLRRETVIRMRQLDLGRFDVGPGKRLIPISAWLFTTDQGRHMLLDTGFPPGYATRGAEMAKTDGLDSFGQLVNFDPRHTILGALALHGLTARDISHVLLSHSHIDHIGGLQEFPDARILVSAAERSLPQPLYFGRHHQVQWPQADCQPLDGTTQICAGLRLLATPGHSPGHMSALVTLPDRATLLAIDAINRKSEPAEGYPDAMDPVMAAASGRKLMQLARRQGARLIPGHEPILPGPDQAA